MSDVAQDFVRTPGHVWLNAASEGPIPRISAQRLQEAVQWKLNVHQLSIPLFVKVPLELKHSIAHLINVDPQDVILGNSATYGIHLLANGLSFQSGDEIILMRNDFPTDILPWLYLKERGVIVHQLKGAGPVLSVEDIQKSITNRTKLVCLPYVHTFSGWALDIKAIGDLCRQRGITFVVNMSQAVGAFEVNMAHLPVDAIVCAGYKWLMGPYGTGFCWLNPELRKALKYPQSYWISLMDENALSGTEEITLPVNDSARRYDVFGTANFFNYVPWKASIDYLSGLGIGAVHAHNQGLVNAAVDGMDQSRFQVISPKEKSNRTNIVVFSCQKPQDNLKLFEHLKAKGLYLAYWKGNLRLSPHIYNTYEDIQFFLKSIYENY